MNDTKDEIIEELLTKIRASQDVGDMSFSTGNELIKYVNILKHI